MKQESIHNKEDAYKTLDLVNYWIGNIDSKNAIGLAFVTAIMAGICYKTNGIIPISAWIQPFRHGEFTMMAIIRFIFSMMLYVSCCISAICFLCSIWGRIRYSSDKKSLFFFGTIASIPTKDYKRAFLKLDDSKMVDELLEQISINSMICSHKAKLYNWGLKFLVMAVILFFGCFFMGFL